MNGRFCPSTGRVSVDKEKPLLPTAVGCKCCPIVCLNHELATGRPELFLFLFRFADILFLHKYTHQRTHANTRKRKQTHSDNVDPISHKYPPACACPTGCCWSRSPFNALCPAPNGRQARPVFRNLKDKCLLCDVYVYLHVPMCLQLHHSPLKEAQLDCVIAMYLC